VDFVGDNAGYGKGSYVLDVFAQFPGRFTAIGSESEQWKLSRKIIHPFFTSSFIEQAANRALSHTLPMAHQLLRSCAESGKPLDFDLFCGHLTLDVLLKILIDVDLGILTPDPDCLTRPHELYDAVCVLSRISSR
jgi:cytochrome P450